MNFDILEVMKTSDSEEATSKILRIRSRTWNEKNQMSHQDVKIENEGYADVFFFNSR